MNGNFTKLISSAAAVLAIGSSAYAQEEIAQQQTTNTACPPKVCTFEQGYGLCANELPSAYNAPARIEVGCSWDFYLSGSFIYWKADQEGMDLAITSSKILTQKFEYKPGFKVDLGIDFGYDSWVGYVEYTWLHQQTKKSYSSDTVFKMTDWYFPYPFFDAATSFESKWRLNIDLLDAVLSRPFYEGKKLTILPFGGLRGAWIRENLRVEAVETVPFVSHNHSHSWGVGPRVGMQAHWLLGSGFRFEGDVAGSLLFTQYDVALRDDFDDGFLNSYDDYNTIRPMADMSVGLGWGTYFSNQNYHVDLLAAYDFNVMWGQNMMRDLDDVANTSMSFEPADLHLQGLTATLRFDF